ncbi:ST3 beta-galactoside alpha-2,3-sialyltransferase 6 [Phyllostomus discolor]|uniref:ST3 beta-galactoside alpha-2,3-sialyltransferase 6 n=1 Tax=Phyllostomus discolor TaxID=89673 RepID=A0A834B270_9CHIR|nr:ST3 beta-galactoside alpha-2,3-sialyltransferase 6 [Phyllostomus discolor]
MLQDPRERQQPAWREQRRNPASLCGLRSWASAGNSPWLVRGGFALSCQRRSSTASVLDNL